MRINSIVTNLNFQKIYKGKEPDPKNTVVIMGAAGDSDDIQKYCKDCAEATKALVLAGKNILTGCGSFGILGSAYNSAKENSVKDDNGKPAQNLAIIKNPLWGDENQDECIVIGKADSEAERIEDFENCANTFVIYPGGAGTIQEAATLIFDNRYGDKDNDIILVGKDYFKGLDLQYQTMYEMDQCKDPSTLYEIVDSPNDVIDKVLNKRAE